MALSAAIILAAGEGTRMRSNKPKVLHTLAGKTFLNRVMDSVAALDPDTLAVVVHYQAERVAEAARSYNEHVTIVDQDDIPGTGRAVQCAMAQLTQKDDLDGAVLIAASDMPLLDTDTLDQLLAFHEKSGNGATVLTTILDDPTGYGRIIRDSEGNVLRIVEQKDAIPFSFKIYSNTISGMPPLRPPKTFLPFRSSHLKSGISSLATRKFPAR